MGLGELVKGLFSKRDVPGRLANNHAENLAKSNMRLSVYESKARNPLLLFWTSKDSPDTVVVAPDPQTRLRYFAGDEPRLSGSGMQDKYSFTLGDTRYELHLSTQNMPLPEGARIQDVPVRTYLERHDHLMGHPEASRMEYDDGHDAAIRYINEHQERFAKQREKKARRNRKRSR
ncbi:hypothetical protein KY327_03955 [Candidatus Woesearchaeota archaeon]|nr:hypothetical protein [Candidatus Woesearchaeota archaeon]